MSSTNPVTAIQSAISQGQISSAVGEDLIEELDDIAMAGCQGVNADDIDSEEATIVACIIDASGSMQPFRHAIVDAYQNQFIKPLQGAKNAKSIFVSTWVFSGIGGCRLVHGYTTVDQCKPLTLKDYNPDGGTPLNDAVHHALTGLVSYGQVLRDNGTRTKCIAVVLSDGEENSSRITATKVKQLSEELLKQEIYVLSYAYFGDPTAGDQYAAQIGFPKHHRISATLNDSEIRRIFGTVSASVISTSQTKVSAASLSANPFFANP